MESCARRSDPPDPGGSAAIDDLVGRLRALRAWAGGVSFATICDGVNAEWTAAGRPPGELACKSTVAYCFRSGRRRLNADLVVAVVRVLHPDPGYVEQWRQALLIVSNEQREAAQVRVQDTLPPDLPGFIGRADELLVLRGILNGCGPTAVGVIEGMAGVGKTRLAVRAAHLLRRGHPFDRVLFVNLRGFHPDPAQPPADPSAVLDGFLRLLGVPGPRIPHGLDARARLFRRRLAGTRALVVLDNAADTDQVRFLLPGTADCPVLITSRRRLAGLDGATSLGVDVFTAGEAIRFLARESGVRATPEHRAASERIVELCGRLPLALGLVAAQIRAKPGWTLTDHADWLGERHRERRVDDRVGLTIDLSYHRLDPAHRRLLRLLALHPAEDFDVYAAAALTGGDVDTAGRGLDRLGADHLIQPSGARRWSMHDLIRVRAGVHVHDEERRTDRRAALTRLFDHYLATVVAAMDALHPGESYRQPRAPVAASRGPVFTAPEEAVTWLEAERPTLLAVAAFAADHGWPAQVVGLARTLNRQLNRTHNREALVLYQHAYRAARLAGDRSGQAHALTDLGMARWRLGQVDPLVSPHQQAIELFESVGDVSGRARAYNNLGSVEVERGHYAVAVGHYRRALELYGEARDPNAQARVLTNLGRVEGRRGNFREALLLTMRAWRSFQECENPDGVATLLIIIGETRLRMGQSELAGRYLSEALLHSRRIGDRQCEAVTYHLLGQLHTRLGDPEAATRHHLTGLTLARDVGDRVSEVWALNGLGEAARAAGRSDEALTRHQAALAIAAATGLHQQHARARAGLGHACDLSGDRPAARRHFEQALRLYSELSLPEAENIRAQLSAA